jgi:hypothetical protein
VILHVGADTGGGGGVTFTQSSSTGILFHETDAQLVSVSNVYQSFTFHVKYTIAVQFAANVILEYFMYVLECTVPVVNKYVELGVILILLVIY